MRKLLLLLGFIALSLDSFSQVPVSLYHESFDTVNAQYKITNRFVQNGAQVPTIFWNDTSVHKTNGLHSYHVKGSATGTNIMFETDSFSTIGFPYVFFSFNQICKLYLANQGRVEISTDGGTIWTSIPEFYYIGSDVSRSALYVANQYYNTGSYVIPSTGLDLWQSTNNGPVASSWWVREAFDLRGIAYDTVANTGYADVRLRFNAIFNFTTPAPALNFYAGWYIDSIQVIGSTCELNPPKINFNIPASVCLDKPEGSQVETPLDNYKVRLLATDKGAGMDRVELIWTNRTTTVRDTTIMVKLAGTNEYSADITSAFLGDTVDWYVEGYDLSCPNVTKSPVLDEYIFWVDSGLPSKCGSPYCGALPNTIGVDVLPWTETFESGLWAAGDNGTTVGGGASMHRGNFPVFPTGYWTLGPSPNVDNQLAWSIANNATATNFTGPTSNHTPGGNKYLYTEGSTLTGNSARVITPCIDLSRNTKCLAFEFYYHMFGDGIKRLRVDVDTGSSAEAWYIGYINIAGAQHSSSSDPWKKAIVGLEDFNGKFIRLRFHAVRDNQAATADKDKCDIAIDDLRIFEPDPAEIEILSFDSPVNGICSYGANEPITLTVRNNGCSTTSAIPLAFSVNGGPIVRDTIYPSHKALVLGDTTQYTLNPPATANLSAFNTYNIKAWSEMPGDNIPGNDTVLSQVIQHNPSISTFPFIEGFENGLPGQQVIGNTNWRFDDGLDPTFRWQVGENMTTTRSTGPFQGNYNGGKYLYTETSGGGLAVSTYFRVLCIDLGTLTAPTLDFYYHTFGGDINGISVEVSLGDQDLETWTALGGSNVGISHTEERDDWNFKRVSLNSYAGQSIKLRFKATRNGGGGILADMALDDIMIYDRLANDAGVESITTPVSTVLSYAATPTIPVVTIRNFGTTSLTSVDVTVNIIPHCGPNAGVPMPYTQTMATNISAGGVGSVSLSGFNLTYPVGEFTLQAYTTKTGDTYAFNDTVDKDFYGAQIYNVPYFDNFDNCNSESGGFTVNPGSTFLQWEFGTPTGNVISSAHSSPNAWVTNLDGNFFPATDEFLIAPQMRGFDSLESVELRFYQYMDFGVGSPASAAGVVEYRNGGTWEAVGGTNINKNIGFNWLGSKFGTQNSAVFNGPAFEGSSQADGGWIFSSYPLNEFNNTATTVLRTRFRFKSNHSINTGINATRNGWGIDDFELWVPGQHSASPIRVRTEAPLPIPGQDQTLLITILNTGAKRLDSCIVDVTIDGQIIEQNMVYSFSPKLFSGRRQNITLSTKWAGASVTSGVHDICIITRLPNNRGDGVPRDDSLCIPITVLGEVDMTLNDSATYCNDFEGTDPNVTPWIALNSETFTEDQSWEKGTPFQNVTPFSGVNVWMTDLDSVYGNLDKSALFTPIFILDANVTYEMSFQHWFKTEAFHDGGNIEVTFDGGLSWRTVGYKTSVDTNWYNTDYVTALDIIKPGFTDTTKTGTWQFADYRMAFKQQGIKAIFRFRFATDYDLNFAGWAIDDFCFNEVKTGPQDVIGEGEYIVPEDVIVADLSPNPTNSHSELSIFAPTQKTANIVIVNSIGQLMQQINVKLDLGANRIDLDGSKWDAGMYIVKIEIEGESFTKKLIITQ